MLIILKKKNDAESAEMMLKQLKIMERLNFRNGSRQKIDLFYNKDKVVLTVNRDVFFTPKF